MPDEAIYARRALELWRHASLPLLHGQGAGYGVVYPLLAGLPLAAGSVARGYASLKLLQALVMSLTALPVFFYGRRIAPPAYALLAAGLTVASPILLYSGLVMTEVVYYPLAAVATFSIARAIASGSRRDQAATLAIVVVAIATRAQAVIFIPIFAAAAVLDALLRRDLKRLSRFMPVWVTLGAGVVVASVTPGVFGAYAGTFNGNYPLALSVRLTYYHLAYAIVMVAVIPVAAGVLLLVDAARRREADPQTRSLVAVTMCSTLLVATQVGFFSARFAPHLLGRDLAALPPPFFLLFSVWLWRRPSRSYRITSVVLVAVLAAVALAPWNDLVSANALPDTFEIALLYRLHEAPSDVVTIGSAVLLLVGLFAPARLAPLSAVLVLLALVSSTVLASNLIASTVRRDQATQVGTPPDWIDRATRASVAFVYDGSGWPVVYQQEFWNRRIADVVSLGRSSVPGPITQTQLATVPPDGAIPVRSRYGVGTSRVSFVGAPLVTHSRGADDYALTLWRLTGRPRLSTTTAGVHPNGDMNGTGRLTAYDCGGGVLHVTLLPKASATMEIDLNGRRVARRDVAGLASWRTTITVPAASQPKVCHFSFRGGPLFGSTVLLFERPGR